jgi:hypothetical protein
MKVSGQLQVPAALLSDHTRTLETLGWVDPTTDPDATACSCLESHLESLVVLTVA